MIDQLPQVSSSKPTQQPSIGSSISKRKQAAAVQPSKIDVIQEEEAEPTAEQINTQPESSNAEQQINIDRENAESHECYENEYAANIAMDMPIKIIGGSSRPHTTSTSIGRPMDKAVLPTVLEKPITDEQLIEFE